MDILKLLLLSTLALGGCSRVDSGYEEGWSNITSGLKYELYGNYRQGVIQKGVVSSNLINCLKSGERMHNVYGKKGDISNKLWLTNGYGIKLRSLNKNIFRYNLMKRSFNGRSINEISKTYKVNCSLDLL